MGDGYSYYNVPIPIDPTRMTSTSSLASSLGSSVYQSSVSEMGKQGIKGGGGTPWGMIGEAIGSIISGIGEYDATVKIARLQEAIGMRELRWTEENDKFYRKLATESQRKKYMIDVVVMQMRMKAEEEGMRKKKTVWNTVIIAGSLIALGIFIPLMITK